MFLWMRQTIYLRPERKTMAEVVPELSVCWARPRSLARSCGTWSTSYRHLDPHHNHPHQIKSVIELMLILQYEYLTPTFSVGSKPMVVLAHLVNDHHQRCPHCPSVLKNLCYGLVEGVTTPGVWVVRTIELFNLCQVCWLEHLTISYQCMKLQ